MELREHAQRLTDTDDALHASIAAHRAVIEEHPYNLLHPDVLKSMGRQVRLLGQAAVELIKLAPHIPEIRQQFKDREQA